MSPLFVFVSAAVSADGAQRRLEQDHRQLHWWAGRARPTVTYLAVLVAFVIVAAYTGGRLLGWLNAILVLLLPQQLGIAWKRGCFSGLGCGLALLLFGLLWLAAAVASGYPSPWSMVNSACPATCFRPPCPGRRDVGAGRRRSDL
ncbi:hypothetical protein [Billgrantia montanilacus]|uniref:hypothetical protein n=1 Tax=Billgrantia montanilacus TaxID=2282305 RepID=UPI0011C04974|nr:hypothetical protein [Halomonas montanilacus]